MPPQESHCKCNFIVANASISCDGELVAYAITNRQTENEMKKINGEELKKLLEAGEDLVVVEALPADTTARAIFPARRICHLRASIIAPPR